MIVGALTKNLFAVTDGDVIGHGFKDSHLAKFTTFKTCPKHDVQMDFRPEDF